MSQIKNLVTDQVNESPVKEAFQFKTPMKEVNSGIEFSFDPHVAENYNIHSTNQQRSKGSIDGYILRKKDRMIKRLKNKIHEIIVHK